MVRSEHKNEHTDPKPEIQGQEQKRRDLSIGAYIRKYQEVVIKFVDRTIDLLCVLAARYETTGILSRQ